MNHFETYDEKNKKIIRKKMPNSFKNVVSPHFTLSNLIETI